MLPAQPNQSLIDGLTVIQALAMRDAPVGCRELARETGIELTKVNRLLKTLAHIGLARQNPRRKYITGPGIHVLASQALHGSGLLKTAFDPLEKLSQLNLIVALGVLWRDQVSYLYFRTPGTSAAQAIGSLGLFPASQSSIGMVTLAGMEMEEVKSLYAGKVIPGYENSQALFFKEVQKTREQGYGLVYRDDTKETSMAVAVGMPLVGAIALSGRMKNNEQNTYLKILKNIAKEITERLEKNL